MRHTRTNSPALCVSVLLLCAAAQALLSTATSAQVNQRSREPATNAPEISYTVSMPKPYTHLLEVEARLRYASAAPNAVNMVMPVWTPGSYLVREYERNVQDFAASDAQAR